MRSCALALLCLIAWPAAAGAATCERRERGPRFVLIHGEGSADGPRRTSVAACDRRTGERRALASGRFAQGDLRRPSRGVRIDQPTLTGATATWVEVRSDARGLRASAVSVHLVGRGPPRRVLLGRTRARRAPHQLQAAPLAIGGLAFLLWSDPVRPDHGSRLVVRRPGRVDATVAAGVASFRVDDGRTLRYFEGNALVYRDLAALPSRDGCPVRQRFRPYRRFGDVIVTLDGGFDVFALRACRVGSGRDPVVGVGGDFGTFGSGTGVDVVAGGGGVIATTSSSYSRYGGCLSSTVRSMELGALATLRSVTTPGCGPGAAPPRGTPAVVTPSGAVAWIGGGRVLALSRDNVVAELDRGDVSGLRADGERIAWANAGAERSAAP